MSGKSRDKHKKKYANKHRFPDRNTFIAEEKQSESELDALLESAENVLRESEPSNDTDLDPCAEHNDNTAHNEVAQDDVVQSSHQLSSQEPRIQQPRIQPTSAARHHSSRLQKSQMKPLSAHQLSGSSRRLSIEQNFSTTPPQDTALQEPQTEESPEFPLTRNISPTPATPRNFPLQQDSLPSQDPTLPDGNVENMENSSPSDSMGPSIVLENHDFFTSQTQEDINDTKISESCEQNETENLSGNQKTSLSQKLFSLLPRPFSKRLSVDETDEHLQQDHSDREEPVTVSLEQPPEPPPIDLVEETVKQTQRIHGGHDGDTCTPHVLKNKKNRNELVVDVSSREPLDDHLFENELDDESGDDEESWNENVEDDDFDAAVREARKKLISAGGLVLLCVGAFFLYNYVGPYVFQRNELVVEADQHEDEEPMESQYVAAQNEGLMDGNPWDIVSDPEFSNENIGNFSDPNEQIANQFTGDTGNGLSADHLNFDGTEFNVDDADDVNGYAGSLSETQGAEYPGISNGEELADASLPDDAPIDDESFDTTENEPVADVDFSVAQNPQNGSEFNTADLFPAGNPAFALESQTIPLQEEFEPEFQFEQDDSVQNTFAQNQNLQEPSYSEPVDTKTLVPNQISLQPSNEARLSPTLNSPAAASRRQSFSSPSVTPQSGQSRSVMQGEMGGAQITVPQSSKRTLPLPNRLPSDAAVESTPASLIASQFDAENSHDNPLENSSQERPMFSVPGPRYENEPVDVPLNLQSFNSNPTPFNEQQYNGPPVSDAQFHGNALGTKPQFRPFQTEESRSKTFAEAGTYLAPLQSPSRLSTADSTNGQFQNPGQNYAQQDSEQQSSSDSYRTYIVQEGDNLFNIAKRELGSVALWKRLYQINRETIGHDARHLVPGTQILIP